MIVQPVQLADHKSNRNHDALDRFLKVRNVRISVYMCKKIIL